MHKISLGKYAHTMKHLISINMFFSFLPAQQSVWANPGFKLLENSIRQKEKQQQKKH